jgi:hypothetical protein
MAGRVAAGTTGWRLSATGPAARVDTHPLFETGLLPRSAPQARHRKPCVDFCQLTTLELGAMDKERLWSFFPAEHSVEQEGS